MKHIFLSFILFLQCAWLCAANPVSVKISDGLSNAALAKKMESRLSALLTEANAASEEKRAIDCKKLGLSDDVSMAIEMLWENSSFVCSDEAVVEHCLTTSSGYQIRNIPLIMKDTDGEAEDEYQEAVVSFDKQGNITSFFIAISMNLYMNVVKTSRNNDLIDLRRRQLILDYVEQFRTSYNQKDLVFLDKVFSEDALIVTGTVIKRKTQDNIKLRDGIVYKKQTKQEYLTKLGSAFKRNKKIHVTFDDIEVKRHPSKAEFYGVTLHQSWKQQGYSDEGYVFLLWDFTNEDEPLIHVRTWQPDQFEGQTLSRDNVFDFGDFDI